MPAYTPRLQQAMQFAAARHGDRTRRITGAAFITHPLAVSLVLTEAGCTDDDVLVAAVLHDLVEDEPVGHDEIVRRFGARVGELVDAMTEPAADEAGAELSWGDRKAHIVELARGTEDPDVLALKAADLICNATDLLGEYARVGADVFARFPPQGGTRQVGYYLELARTLAQRRLAPALAAQLATVVTGLEELSATLAHITAP